MNQDNRTKERLPFQKECILGDQYSWIETQIFDISKMGIGVKTDSPLPFKNGCELVVFSFNMDLPQAKLVWTKKYFNKTTRLGLKFNLEK